MQFQASKHLKSLLFFILLLHFQSSVTAEEPTFFVCGSSNYTSGSQYDTNLNTILPTLSRNGLIRHDSFYNNSYGDGANTIYGYSQCMSGASVDVCRQCFVNSTADIIRLCPNKTEATIRYFNCILRYSNQRFFSELDLDIRISAYPVQNASNVTLFNAQASGLMNDLATAAASVASKYAVNFTKYDSFQRIYGLAQCTRDLSESSCNDCLGRMIGYVPSCCDGRTGANVYSVSCNIRYDMYIFFPLPPPPPPVAADSPTPAGSPDRPVGRWQSPKTSSVACCCKWMELQQSLLIARGRDSVAKEKGVGFADPHLHDGPPPPTLSDRSHRHLPERLTSSTSSRCPDQSPTALPL